MIPSYLEKVRPVQPFDPEGDGYDYTSAVDSGGRPDEQTKHWQSIDPRTGMVLKGKNHPTWNLMVEEETKLGNSIVKAKDGRYYSVKTPSYLSKVKPVTGSDFQDSPEEVTQKAASDYQFALDNNVTLDFFDAVKEDWGSAQSIANKIPFFGVGFEMAKKSRIALAAERLSKNIYPETETDTFVRELRQEAIRSGTDAERNIAIEQMIADRKSSPKLLKENDKKLVSAYLKYLAADKTTMYKIENGVSVLPTWIAEFAMTGGLASLGDGLASAAAKKILSSYSTSTVGKLAVKTAGWASGTATRTFGLTGQVGAKYVQQDVDEILKLKEETGWATKLMRSWGDVYIEALSESAGEGLTKGGGYLLGKLPFGNKAVDALSETWMSITGGTKGEFLRKMSTKAGYSNILGEIGEERLGTTLRALADVDTFGEGENSTALDRLKAGWVQDIENIWVEIGVLSVPMGAQAVGGRIVNRTKTDKILTEIGAKTEELKAAEQSAQDIRGQIESQIATETPTMPVDAKVEESGTITPAESVQSVGQRSASGENIDSSEVKVNPTRIDEANVAKEIDSVVAQLASGRADPQKSSLREVDVNNARMILGLDGVPSEARKSQLADLQNAKDNGYVENAEEVARRVISGGAAMDRIEAAGALIRMAQLDSEYRAKKRLLSQATEPLAISSLNIEIERIVERFDNLTTAIKRSGSEAGRRLNMQKLTIDENYDYLSVVTKAKAKRGKELTLEQTANFQKLTDELEQAQRDIKRLKDEVAELMAKAFLKQGGVRKYKDMNRSEIELERDSLLAEISKYKEC